MNANGWVAITITVPPSAVGAVEAEAYVIDAVAPSGFTATNGVTFTAR